MNLTQLERQCDDTLALMGGIDGRAMAHPDSQVIEEEIGGKLKVTEKGGGYVYHGDHSVPSNVRFDQYRRVMELVRRCGWY
jgi:hypothetical protein